MNDYCLVCGRTDPEPRPDGCGQECLPSVEEWRPVVGYEGHYEVSSLGRVRSCARTLPHRLYGQRRWPEKILKLQPDPDGRVQVRLNLQGEGKTFRVHRLVAMAFLGEPPSPDMEVCHANGNPSDNRVENLRWDTRTENIYDAVRHGTHYQAAKTQCPRGHALKMPNLRAGALRRGRRDCLACGRAGNYLQKRPDAGSLKEVADRYYERIMNGKTGLHD